MKIADTRRRMMYSISQQFGNIIMQHLLNVRMTVIQCQLIRHAYCSVCSHIRCPN